MKTKLTKIPKYVCLNTDINIEVSGSFIMNCIESSEFLTKLWYKYLPYYFFMNLNPCSYFAQKSFQDTS